MGRDCEYCGGEPFNIIENAPFNEFRIELVVKGSKLAASVYNGGLKAYGEKKIKFCPMCGREL